MGLSEVKLLGSSILVKEFEEGEQSVQGVIVPAFMASNEKRPIRGMVVKVGPGYRQPGGYDPLVVAAGDEVLFFECCQNVVKLPIGDEELWLLDEGHVLVVLSSAAEPARVI